MYCIKCGTETKHGAQYCHACGQNLEKLPQSSIDIRTPASAAVVSSSMTANAQKPEYGYHPWRRFFARTVDLLSFALFCVGIVSTFPGQAASIAGAISNPIVASVVVYFLWIPIEAVFLATIGTTPAKWVFGIRVSNSDGRNLSYSDAMKRALLACIYGDGFGIPIVALFTRGFAYNKLNRTGTTKWDTAAGSVVQLSEWGLGRGVGATIVVAVAMLGGSFLLTIGNMQEAKHVTKVGQIQTEKTQLSKSKESPEKKPVVDLEKIRELEVAANQGDAVAKYELGKMYFREGSHEDAARWLSASASQGYAPAQDHLANLLYSGFGVPKDPKEAVRLYRLAAEQGILGATYSLGSAYEDGQGVPQDIKESLRYYGLAADQGYMDAVFALARWYSKPLLQSTDAKRKQVVAYALYNLGCARSCRDDQIQARDFYRNELDDKQVDVGQALTREMMEGKPTRVIARYLKTGVVAK